MSRKSARLTGSTTRRQFFRRSATTAAGLALAAPSLLPASALGIGRTAPSERITLGFIGLGWKGFEGCWGSLLQTFIADQSAQVLAACDVDRRYLERAKEFVDQTYGTQDCAMYGDFRDLVVRPDLDAVVIATPDHWHAAQTIWACREGKDVFCEKPLSLTVREARDMVQAARRFQRVVQTGSQSRSNGRVRFGCEVVRQGRIGQDFHCRQELAHGCDGCVLQERFARESRGRESGDCIQIAPEGIDDDRRDVFAVAGLDARRGLDEWKAVLAGHQRRDLVNQTPEFYRPRWPQHPVETVVLQILAVTVGILMMLAEQV